MPSLSICKTLISLFITLFSSSVFLYTVNLPVALSYLFNPLSVAIQISFPIPVMSFILLLLKLLDSLTSLKNLVTSFSLTLFTPALNVPIQTFPSSSSYIPHTLLLLNELLSVGSFLYTLKSLLGKNLLTPPNVPTQITPKLS